MRPPDYPNINYDGYKYNLGFAYNLKLGLNFKFSQIKLGTGLDLYGGFEFGSFLNFRRDAIAKHIIEGDNDARFAIGNVFIFTSYYFTPESVLNVILNVRLDRVHNGELPPGFISPIISFQSGKYVYYISSGFFIPSRVNFGIMTSLPTIF